MDDKRIEELVEEYSEYGFEWLARQAIIIAINETKEEAYEELIHLLEYHSDETREGLICEMKKELSKLRASKVKP